MLDAHGTSLIKSLRGCRLFREMTEADLSKLIQQAAVERYQAGDILFRQDDAAGRLFVVLEGRIVLYLDKEGDPSGVTRIAGPGETFAEACICGLGSYSVTAEALSRTTSSLSRRSRSVRCSSNASTWFWRCSARCLSGCVVSSGRSPT